MPSVTPEEGGMAMTRSVRRAAGWVAGAAGVAAVGYAAYAGMTWYRYGRPARAKGEDVDSLLDQFMPEYDVAERHHVRVAAPAQMTLSAAADTDLQQSPIIRAIFRTRELVLGANPMVWRARKA
jgi:uncharacterized membrane protein YebE (DUF533 family)